MGLEMWPLFNLITSSLIDFNQPEIYNYYFRLHSDRLKPSLLTEVCSGRRVAERTQQSSRSPSEDCSEIVLRQHSVGPIVCLRLCFWLVSSFTASLRGVYRSDRLHLPDCVFNSRGMLCNRVRAFRNQHPGDKLQLNMFHTPNII